MERSAFSKAVRAGLVTFLSLAPPFCVAWMMWYAVSWDSVLLSTGVDAMFSFIRPFRSSIAISGWVIFAALLVAFPLWLRDVSHLISVKSALPFSPMRAALAFFVPFQQIGLPYSITRSLSFRLNGKVGRDPLLLAWWCSWILMLPAGIYYAADYLFRLNLMRYSHLVLWVYGSAALFCMLALLVVLRIERGLNQIASDCPVESSAALASSASSTSGLLTVEAEDAGVPINLNQEMKQHA